jgi:hypothetical protein
LSGKQYAWRPTIWFAAKGDHQKMVTMREQHKNTISGVGLQSSQREKRKVQTGHWLRHYILQVPMSVGTFVSKFKLKCTKRLGNLQSEGFLNDAVSGNSVGPAHRPAIQFPPRRFHRFFYACPSRLRFPETRPKGCILHIMNNNGWKHVCHERHETQIQKINHVCHKMTN